MRILLLPLLCSLAAVSLAEDKAPKREPEHSADETAKIIRSLEPRFRQILTSTKTPGVGIVVVKDDKIVYLQGLGYRNIEKKLPFTPDSICQIASTSKAFCGITACMAVQDGLLSLDESPKRLLPDFSMRDPEADRSMTIADLMCHSSGLPRTDLGWWPGKIDAQTATSLLTQGEPTYPFRYLGQYSNMMVETAGRAVGEAYRKPWTTVLQEKVTGPLGMTSTRKWTLIGEDPNRQATGYYTTMNGETLPEPPHEYSSLAAAGGLQSTARDMAAWLRFHLNEGQVDGKRLLTPELVREAHRPRFSFSGTSGYGLGWFVDHLRPDEIVSHGGDLPGFQTNVVLCPSRRLGFAVLANNDSTNSRPQFEAAILDKLVGKQDLREIKKATKVTGLYWSPEGSHRIRIAQTGPELLASLDDARPIRMRKTAEDVWKSFDPRDPKLTLTAQEDKKRRGKKSVNLLGENGTTRYALRPTSYRPDITPKELYKRVAEAQGAMAAREGKVVECRFTARYASDAVDSVGLLYRAPTDKFGTLESYWVGDLRTMYGQNAFRPGRSASADSSYRLDESPVDPRMTSMAGYCNESAGLPMGAKVEIVGEVVHKGEPAYAVLTTWPSGAYRIDTISKSRYLPLRRQVPGALTETYEDYKVVDGIAVPIRLTQQDSGLSETRITITSARAIDRDAHWAFYPQAWPTKK